MELNEQQYTKGFNHGYLLARYLPDLLLKIIKGINPSTDYLSGFFAGKEEYEIEKSRNQVSELSRLRDKSRNRESGLELE